MFLKVKKIKHKNFNFVLSSFPSSSTQILYGAYKKTTLYLLYTVCTRCRIAFSHVFIPTLFCTFYRSIPTWNEVLQKLFRPGLHTIEPTRQAEPDPTNTSICVTFSRTTWPPWIASDKLLSLAKGNSIWHKKCALVMSYARAAAGGAWV